ncbi:MAG: ribosomal RNA small subunit methyltransferase A [Ignavibacteriales bacterium]|nr:ribosomal RNA small subunit methyltransferase A [Ignavibacteriales bacterium]
MASPKVTFKPKQSLGQNYLIDDNVARKIVDSINPEEKNVVIEIGPGQGALTQHLVKRVDRLIAFEIDQRVIGGLQEKYRSRNIEIVHADFLQVPLVDLAKKYKSRLTIIGNIPYHLTSPILFKIFDELEAVENLTMMMQKEVARRLVASSSTKDYGILSVFSQYYSEPEILFNVSPNCFYPKPKVISSVVRLNMKRDLYKNIDDKLFRKIVKIAFGKRRKTLKNSLAYLPFHKNVIDLIIGSDQLPLKKRPEELKVSDFIELTMKIQKLIV